MTLDESIKVLENLDDWIDKQPSMVEDWTKVSKALDLAIKALEQQPCEDTEVIKVSKGAVKARRGRFVIYDVEWLKEHFYLTEEKIYGQPKQPCKNCISRESLKQKLQEEHDFFVNAYGGNFKDMPYEEKVRVDEITNCIAMVVNEPPVTPQRPKGKWIEVDVHNFYATLKCSVCDRVIEPYFSFGEYSYEDIKTFYPYCHCGAEMSGGGEG